MSDTIKIEMDMPRQLRLLRHCLNQFESLIEIHRASAYLTCHESCLCWKIEAKLVSLENIYLELIDIQSESEVKS